MADTKLTVALVLSDASFSKKLKDVNAGLKETDSEFKRTISGMDNFGDSMEDQSNKIKHMTQVQTQLSGKMQLYADEISKVTQAQDKQANKYKEQEAKLEAMRIEYGRLSDEMGKSSDEAKDFKVKLDAQEKSFKNLETNIVSTELKMKGLRTELNKTETEFNEYERGIKEAKKAMDGFKAEELSRQINDLADNLQDSGDKFTEWGDAIGAVGDGMNKYVAEPLLNMGKGALETGINFEAGMAKVQAITGGTETDMARLSAEARRLGKDLPQSATSASEGMALLGQAGWSTDEIMASLESIMKGATASGLDMANMSEKVTDSMNSFGLTADQAGMYLDNVALISNKSSTGMGQMMDAMLRVAPSARDLGIPLKDLTNGIGILANNGFKGATAGTKLNSMMLSLTAPSKGGAEALKAMNVEVFDQNKQFRGLLPILKDMEKGTRNMTQAEKDANLKRLVGRFSLTQMKVLLSSVKDENIEGAKGWNGLAKEMENSNGALDNMSEIVANSPQGKIESLKSAFEEMQLQINEFLLPAFERFIKWISDLIGKFHSLDYETKNQIIWWSKVALVVAGATMVLGKIITSIGMTRLALGGLTRTMDGSARSGGLFGKAMDLLRGRLNTTDGAVGRTGGALGLLRKSLTKVGGGVSSFGGTVARLSPRLGGMISGLGGSMGAMAGMSGAVLAGVPALVGLMAVVGDNEGAILKLQEKFGSLGTIIGGVCEFVGGVVQLTFGGILNMLMLIGDVIEAMLDGAGGKTVNEAWNRFNSRQELTVKEGMDKIKLTTTRGMVELRGLTDTELTGLNTSWSAIQGQIPNIVAGNFSQASTAIATSMAGMNQNQLNALRGMNDTSRTMFGNIKASMTIEEKTNEVAYNLGQMYNSGKFSAEELEKAVTEAMGMTAGQMDQKTAEGATAVAGNLADATGAVEGASVDMTASAETGAGNVATAFVDETGKIPDVVQGNLAKSMTSIETTMQGMANEVVAILNSCNVNVKTAFQDMANGVVRIGASMVVNVKTQANNMKDGFMTSTNTMSYQVQNMIQVMCNKIVAKIASAVANVNGKWNGMRTNLQAPIRASVEVKRTTLFQKKHLPDVQGISMVNYGLNSLVDSTVATINDSVYIPNGRAVSPRFGGSASVSNMQTSSHDDNGTAVIVQALQSQNELLMKMLGVMMDDNKPIISNISIDGRQVAQATAGYMKNELGVIDKRSNRLGGRF